jgi:hypothetical protein
MVALLSDDFGHPPDLLNVYSEAYDVLNAESVYLNFLDYNGCYDKRRYSTVE